MKKSVVSKNIASNFFFWDCPKCSRRNSNVLSECEICGSSSALVDVARGTADDKVGFGYNGMLYCSYATGIFN